MENNNMLIISSFKMVISALGCYYQLLQQASTALQTYVLLKHSLKLNHTFHLFGRDSHQWNKK